MTQFGAVVQAEALWVRHVLSCRMAACRHMSDDDGWNHALSCWFAACANTTMVKRTGGAGALTITRPKQALIRVDFPMFGSPIILDSHEGKERHS